MWWWTFPCNALDKDVDLKPWKSISQPFPNSKVNQMICNKGDIHVLVLRIQTPNPEDIGTDEIYSIYRLVAARAYDHRWALHLPVLQQNKTKHARGWSLFWLYGSCCRQTRSFGPKMPDPPACAGTVLVSHWYSWKHTKKCVHEQNLYPICRYIF